MLSASSRSRWVRRSHAARPGFSAPRDKAPASRTAQAGSVAQQCRSGDGCAAAIDAARRRATRAPAPRISHRSRRLPCRSDPIALAAAAARSPLGRCRPAPRRPAAAPAPPTRADRLVRRHRRPLRRARRQQGRRARPRPKSPPRRPRRCSRRAAIRAAAHRGRVHAGSTPTRTSQLSLAEFSAAAPAVRAERTAGADARPARHQQGRQDQPAPNIARRRWPASTAPTPTRTARSSAGRSAGRARRARPLTRRAGASAPPPSRAYRRAHPRGAAPR